MQLQTSSFQTGVELTKSRKYPEALKAFSAEIEKNPNDFASYLNRGSLECCLGLDEFAIDDFTKVIEIQPFEITGYYNRFIAYYKVGRKDQAQRDLYIAISLAYMRKGEEIKSVGMIGKALEIVQNNVLAHIKRAAIYKEQGNLQLALNDYTGALRADENNLTVLKLRASLYHQLGQQDQSKQDVGKIALLSDHPSSSPSSLVLIPNIPQMTASQIQQDINSKVKQFTSIRKQIYKGGYQHSTTLHQTNNNNQLQTTIGRQTHVDAVPTQVKAIEPSDNKLSLGNLQDFAESSLNQNSNTLLSGLGGESKKNVNVDEHSSISVQKDANEHAKQNQGDQNQAHILSSQTQVVHKSQPQASEISKQQIHFQQSKQSIQQQQHEQQQNPKDKQTVAQQFNKQIKQQLPTNSKSLEIHISSAELVHNTEWLGKMSPYVFIAYNGWEQTTEVLKQAGSNPQWNQNIKFVYAEEAQTLNIKIFDKETFKNDDLIAQGEFDISECLGEQTLTLTNNNQQAANLKINGSIIE